MRIQRVRIENYRSIRNLELNFDDVTVLLGANGAGKSSILYALDWFFNGGELEAEDLAYGKDECTVSVEVIFNDLTQKDREVLEKYGRRDTARFQRTWDPESGVKLTGNAKAYEPFERIRSIAGARDLSNAYNQLARDEPDLGLIIATSKDKAQKEMENWEHKNAELLQDATTSATHMFGFAGTAKLAGIFGFSLVRAHGDAASETSDARGTLMAQLIERATGSIDLEIEIDDLIANFETDLKGLLGEKYEPILRSVEKSVGASLRQYVGDADINLDVGTTEMRVPTRRIILQASDGDFHTDIGRQGQGFQRALLIAVLQELAGISIEEKNSSLLIAIEEPELYQHPTQSRHFASVLRGLTGNSAQRLQVIYATHSPYFVDPGAFEGLRRISKEPDEEGVRSTKCIEVSFEGVRDRLANAGLDGATYIEKARITLRRHLGEAVFARVALLVEGPSDAGMLRGIAMRHRGLDALGIACAPLGGKTEMPMAIAVLQAMGVPIFALFDGDASMKGYLGANSSADSGKRNSAKKAAEYNNIILNMLEEQAADWPTDTIGDHYACFEDCLEAFLKQEWPDFLQAVGEEKARSGIKSSKPEGIYEQVAGTLDGVPSHLMGIIEAAGALTREEVH